MSGVEVDQEADAAVRRLRSRFDPENLKLEIGTVVNLWMRDENTITGFFGAFSESAGNP